MRQLRKERGLTQGRLAYKLNLNHASVSRFEQEEQEPDIRTLIAYARFFNVTIDYILCRTNHRLAYNDVDMKLMDFWNGESKNSTIYDIVWCLAALPESSVSHILKIIETFEGTKNL